MYCTIQAVSVPQKVCFMDLTQLNKFIKQLNSMQMCATQGYKGELTAVKMSTIHWTKSEISYTTIGIGQVYYTS